MNKIIIAFMISFLASISTLLGTIPIFISEKYREKIISFSLAFAAGVMINISLFSLIPEAFNYLSNGFSFFNLLSFIVFFVLGIIIAKAIDSFIKYHITNDKLYQLGIMSILILIIHNIPEGIISFLTASTNTKLGITLSIAIALHNIPEGIIIAIPLYYSINSKRKIKSLLFTSIAGFSEFLGAFLAYFILYRYINNFILFVLLSVTAGVMINISFRELLPNSINYNNDEFAFIGLLSGFLIMLLTVFII